MADNNIKTTITLDGDKEFQSAVLACNKSLASLRAEMKLVEIQAMGQANSLDTLKKKNDVLANTLDALNKKEEAINNGRKESIKQYDEISKALDENRAKLEKMSGGLSEMAQASAGSDEAAAKNAETLKNLTAEIKRQEEACQTAENQIQEWNEQLYLSQEQTIQVTKALGENAKYMKEAEASNEGCADSIDKLGQKTKSLSERIEETSGKIKSGLLGTAAKAVAGMAGETVTAAMNIQDAQNQLQASTGATAQEMEKYGSVMKDIYNDDYGKSMNDVASAMAMVRQYTNETDPDKIKSLTENAMILSDTFGISMSDALNSVDALMINMGVDSQTAFDYIANGAQNGLNKSGELTNNIEKYSELWGRAGFSANEMFGIMQNGLNTGTYSLSQANAFVQDFSDSLSDGRIAASLDSFSGGTQNLFLEWKNGNATTRDVFESVIGDLSSMADRQGALTLASKTWSSLGKEDAMKIISSMNDVNSSYNDAKGTMESLKDVKYDSLSSQYEALGRTFKTEVAAPIIEQFLPIAQSGIKLLADNIEVIGPIAAGVGTALGTMYVANKADEFLTKVHETSDHIKTLITDVVAHTAATTAEAGALGAAAGAQEVLNTAMSANTIGLVVAGISALVGIVGIFAGNVDSTALKTDELSIKADELNTKMKDASQSLSEVSGEWDGKLSIQVQEGVVNGLVEELYSLEAQSGKSEETLKRMNSITGELNQLFPELSLSVDQNTGMLSQNREQLEQSIDASLNYAKAQAAQERMVEIAREMTDADMAKFEAEQNLNDIGTELLAIEAEREKVNEASMEALKNGNGSMIEYNGSLQDTTDVLMQLSDREAELADAKEKEQENLDNLNEAYSEANDKYQEAYNYASELNKTTEESTEAIGANTEAVNENLSAVEAHQAARATSIETAGHELEVYNSLSEAQQQMAVDVTNGVLTMKENVQGALESQMNMFEHFNSGTEISKDTLLENMQSQVEGVEQWEQSLSEMATAVKTTKDGVEVSIDKGILQKLAAMGPEGAGYVKAFSEMSGDELAAANELWGKSVDIKSMTNTWGEELLTSGAVNIAGGMGELRELMSSSGADTVTGFITGMQNAQGQALAASQDLGVKIIDSIDSGLGCASPSKKTMRSGHNIGDGLVLGINDKMFSVTSAGSLLARLAIESIENSASIVRVQSLGLNIAAAFADGIRAGRSAVVNAMTAVCESAIQSARHKLQINSPSRIFRGFGVNSMDGYALGIKDETSYVNKTVSQAMDFSRQPYTEQQISSQQIQSGPDYRTLVRAFTAALGNMDMSMKLNGREFGRVLTNMGVTMNG
ncbi:phage tail tape measure protein [Lacrimispora sp. NSJ-141]|uniref:Phage tail tape measure protein n=1 Tax=Lientehia hominis TaxID=2897778 RepID=A0AAP2WAG4_9FIRM|nr:phage tail tape measure protein [Lientehia hominis]MCD2493317.1 phage tail tape measure protein [Lientehia hominis]